MGTTAAFGNILLWGLLALALLLLVLGLFQLIRPHFNKDGHKTTRRFAGFMTLLSGVLLGFFSLFSWSPQMDSFNSLQNKWSAAEGRDSKLSAENGRLAGLLKSREGKLQTLRVKNDSLNSLLGSTNKTVKKLVGDVKSKSLENLTLEKRLKASTVNQGEVTRLNAVVARLNEDRSNIKDENSRLKGLLSNNRTDGDSDEVTRLNGVITRLNATKTTMGNENTRLKGLLSTNRTDNSEITRLNGVITRLNATKTTMGNENTRLKGLLSTNRTDNNEVTRLNGVITRLNKNKADVNTENERVKGLLRAYRNDSEVQSAKIASLETDLTNLRKRPVVTRTITAPRQASPLSLINQHNQNNANLRLASKQYHITKMKKTNLVRGRNGHYYNILLKNPANGKGYRFASASYSKVEPETTFKQSLDKVIADIKRAFDGRRKFQLFVRGKASAGRYIGKKTPGYEYKNIKVLEQFRGRYNSGLDDFSYGPMVTNDDLPNLRGAYLQELIGKNYKVNSPIILDGKVSKSKDASKQAVALVLFVED